MEKQKAGLPLGEDAVKKMPAMTAGEYERLGDTYLRQGNMNMAFVQYDKALRLEPSVTRIRYKLGILFVKRGLAEEAIKEFQGILKNDAHFALAYEGIGESQLSMGHVGDAENNFRRALALNPELWQSHNFLGIMYDRQKRFEEAIAEYQAALALKPEQGLVFNNLGMAYFHQGAYERAVQALIGAVKTGVTQTKVYNNLGLVLAKLGRYQEALQAFKEGGDEARAYNNLGMVYLGEQKYQEAIASFEKAVQLNPSYYLKANENLKIAQQEFFEVTHLSATQSHALMQPPHTVAATQPDNSDPAPHPPELRPSTPDNQAAHPSLGRPVTGQRLR